MKKTILLFAMLLAVGGVSAYDKNINLKNPVTNKANWDALTNTLTFDNYEGYADFSVEGVDTYESLEVLVTAIDGPFRICLYSETSWFELGADDKEKSGTAYGAVGLKTLSTNVIEKIGSITKIRIKASGTGSKSVAFTSVTFKELKVNSNTEGFGGLSFTGTQSSLLSGLKGLPYVINQSGFNYLLGSDGTKNGTGTYFDVTDYSALYFKITDYKSANVQLRASVGNSSETNKTYYAKKVGTENPVWTTESAISENGWYYISLDGVTALRAISTQSLGAASERFTVSNMYLTKTSFAITDGKDVLDVVYDPVGTTVAYDRTFTVDQKSSICLPFALTAEEVAAAGTFYELKSVSGTTLNFESVTETEAYKPYMFKAKTATPFASLTGKTIVASEGAVTSYEVGGYTFQGTLAHQTVASGVYGWNATNGEFSKTNTDDVTIDAFRAYITGGAGARLSAVFDDEPTAIQTVKAASAVESGATYNLQGQRVSEGHKGLVIKNGRKYIIR